MSRVVLPLLKFHVSAPRCVDHILTHRLDENARSISTPCLLSMIASVLTHPSNLTAALGDSHGVFSCSSHASKSVIP